jgi:outer membrane protein assembly factor BamB
MKTLFTFLLIAILSLHVGIVLAESDQQSTTLLDWSFKTGNLIYSTVNIDDTLLYAGGFDSVFHAINLSGVEQWHFNTGFPIKCEAVITGSLVCFQSANQLYALNKVTGNLLWKHQPAETTSLKPILQLDPWDMKDASPIVNDGIIYYGNEYGFIYGIKVADGTEVLKFQTAVKSPIRTKPAIANNVIFFGDHEGYVYGVDITSGTLKWSMRTNGGEKPYAQFGGIFGDMVVEGGLLYFGIRNSRFQVLDVMNGNVVWEYESGGTWLSGTPYIDDKSVFVGTSDTHELCAFDKASGKLKWKKSVQYGVYNAPLEIDDKLFVFTGDEQHPSAMPGWGKLFVINKDGTIENAVRLPGSVFNTPAIKNGKLYFTALDGTINCLSVAKIYDNPQTFLEIDQSEINLGVIDKNNTVTKPLCFVKNSGIKADTLIMSVIAEGLPKSAIKLSPPVCFLAGLDSVQLKVQLNPKEFGNGLYSFTINIAAAGSPDRIIEKRGIFSKNIVTGNDKELNPSSGLKIFPNPCSDYAIIDFNGENEDEIYFEVYDISGKIVLTSLREKGEKSYLLTTDRLKTDYYIVKVFRNEFPTCSAKLLKQ